MTQSKLIERKESQRKSFSFISIPLSLVDFAWDRKIPVSHLRECSKFGFLLENKDYLVFESGEKSDRDRRVPRIAPCM